MSKISLNDISQIKGYPIKSLTLFWGEPTAPELELVFEGHNLLDESNFAIDPVTEKNSIGGSQVLYYKISGSFYVVTNDPTAAIWLDDASKKPQINALIKFGNTGSIANEGNANISFYQTKGLTIATKRETTQGFFRYVIQFDNVSAGYPVVNVF